MTSTPVMTREEMADDYPRLSLEYTRLHEEWRRLQDEEDGEDGRYKCYSCLYYGRAHSADHCTSCDTNFSNYTKKQ